MWVKQKFLDASLEPSSDLGEFFFFVVFLKYVLYGGNYGISQQIKITGPFFCSKIVW